MILGEEGTSNERHTTRGALEADRVSVPEVVLMVQTFAVGLDLFVACATVLVYEKERGKNIINQMATFKI